MREVGCSQQRWRGTPRSRADGRADQARRRRGSPCGYQHLPSLGMESRAVRWWTCHLVPVEGLWVARTSREGGQESDGASCTGASSVTNARPVRAEQRHSRTRSTGHFKGTAPAGRAGRGVRPAESVSAPIPTRDRSLEPAGPSSLPVDVAHPRCPRTSSATGALSGARGPPRSGRA